jgi:hypothetical protein
MFHRHDPDDLKPCPHMENLVSAWVDGKLTGLKLWYTRWHVGQCARCKPAVPVLEALRDRLRRLAEHDTERHTDEYAALTPDRRAALEAAWERVDQTQ